MTYWKPKIHPLICLFFSLFLPLLSPGIQFPYRNVDMACPRHEHKGHTGRMREAQHIFKLKVTSAVLLAGIKITRAAYSHASGHKLIST